MGSKSLDERIAEASSSTLGIRPALHLTPSSPLKLMIMILVSKSAAKSGFCGSKGRLGLGLEVMMQEIFVVGGKLW